MTRTELERIAQTMRVWRPDWAWAPLVTHLTRYQHLPADQLAVAAVRCAIDPTARTPAALAEGGDRYWAATHHPAPVAVVDRVPCATHDVLLPAGASCPLCRSAMSRTSLEQLHTRVGGRVLPAERVRELAGVVRAALPPVDRSSPVSVGTDR